MKIILAILIIIVFIALGAMSVAIISRIALAIFWFTDDLIDSVIDWIIYKFRR